MPLIPQTFPIPQETAIASYNFTDIAEGTGVVVFFGAAHDEAGTTKYFLTQNQIFSRYTSLSATTNNTALVQILDEDFDVTFNLPQRMKGKVRIAFSMGYNGPSNQEKQVRVTVKLRKFDGSTETELGSAVTEIFGGTGTDGKSANNALSLTMNLEIDMSSTITHFKKGETLRLIVEGWYRITSGSNTVHLLLGHDPKNRRYKAGERQEAFTNEIEFANEPQGGGTLTYQKTQMLFHVPFVLDI